MVLRARVAGCERRFFISKITEEWSEWLTRGFTSDADGAKNPAQLLEIVRKILTDRYFMGYFPQLDFLMIFST